MLEELEQDISEISLKPSTGGVFEVMVDGELVASKKAKGKHVDNEVIVAAISERSRR